MILAQSSCPTSCRTPSIAPRARSLGARSRKALTAGLTVGVTLLALLVSVQPSAAAWDGETVEKNSSKAFDAILVRPLATVRVVVGAVLFVPASLFASPSGREGIGGAYDVLIGSPIEYAFDRKLGEF
jgi:hypothetical protein